jgi:hypothetical protein|tara:strand:- start:32 stop:298 length:267 start_codon:yes stop_codon:yes gene_type:complete
MTCLNSLKLKQIQEKNPGVFDMPKSICIPMTIPVHFAIKEAGIYKKMKSMFKQIDALSSQDSQIGKEVLDSLLKAANSVISSNDQQVT